MKPVTKKILIISASLMGAGVILTCAGIAAGGWPGFMITRTGLYSASSHPESSEHYVMEKTQIDELSELDINIGSEADIILEPSGDDHFYLEYTLDGSYGEPSYEISDGILHFGQSDSGGVINGIYFFSPGALSEDTEPVVRLYIPDKARLSGINIYNDYGDVSIRQIKAEQADISLDFGDMELSDSSFTTAVVCLGSGDLEADASSIGDLTFTNEFGDSEFNSMAVTSADITVESGDLTLDATDLETLTGVNEFGDTTFILHGPLDGYAFDLTTEFGEIHVPAAASGALNSTDSSEMSYISQTDSSRKIEFTAQSGDIELKTAEQ